mmetsp:Transcript_130/g.280  ORF Transcript_130/g.280 Transcript_130/m.280 type:complete len:717 (-) Transcript_130:33-2183(-)
MKFGKQILRLAEQSHINHCVAYDVLKKAITVVVEAELQAKPNDELELKEVSEAFGKPVLAGVARPPDSRFHGLLQHELDKVNRFANLQYRLLIDGLREAQRLAAKDPKTEEELSELERVLDTTSDKLIQFEHFRRLNFTGFRKIVKKFDKRSKEVGLKTAGISGWFMQSLLREYFVSEPLDPILFGLALGFATHRHLRRVAAKSPEPTPSTAAPIGSKVTETFLVSPPGRLGMLCALIKRFELVVPTPFAKESLSPLEKMRLLLHNMTQDGSKSFTGMGSRNTVVYYDDPKFSQYSGRLQNNGVAGFRYRQTTPGDSSDDGVVERDGTPSALGVNAFTNSSELACTDAFPLSIPTWESQASVNELLKSAASKYASRAPGLAQTVQEAVSNDMEVKAVVSSSRLLLRGDTAATEGFFLALDEDVRFTKTHMESSSSAPSSGRDFCYCLLEVASSTQESASWLEELYTHASLRSVSGFTIGAYAVADQHTDKVPELPHYYEHFKIMQDQAPPEQWGLMLEWRAALNAEDEEEEDRPAQSKAAKAASEILPSEKGATSGGGGGTEPPKSSTSVAGGLGATLGTIEPKNFLASERTMLEWIHTILALAFLGMGLWKYSLTLGGDGPQPQIFFLGGLLNVTSTSSMLLGCYSLLLVSVALVFVWYAVLSHVSRLNALFKNKVTESVFNDRTAPTIFVVAITGALFMQLSVQAITGVHAHRL